MTDGSRLRRGLTWLAATTVLTAAVYATAAAPSPQVDVDLGFPLGLVLDSGGRLLVSERAGNRVVRIDLEARSVETIAGIGEAGFSGDGGPATAARLSCPDAIDLDAAGNLYVADRCNERIRRIDGATGIITTVVGNGERGPAPDGPALGVALTGPFYVRVAGDEVLFTDTDAHLVRAYDPVSRRVVTLAGNGEGGFSGDGGPALEASLRRPHVALRNGAGELVIGDSMNQRIRVVGVDGVIRTIAGDGREGPAIDGSPALETPFFYFGQILEARDGDLVFTEWWTGRLLRLDAAAGRVRVLAGDARVGDAGPPLSGPIALDTEVGPLAGLATDTRGRYLVTAAPAGRVYRIDLDSGTIEPVTRPTTR